MAILAFIRSITGVYNHGVIWVGKVLARADRESERGRSEGEGIGAEEQYGEEDEEDEEEEEEYKVGLL